MIAINKNTTEEYEVTGQVNVLHIENEQEVLYTHYSIEPDDSDVVTTIELLEGEPENAEFIIQ